MARLIEPGGSNKEVEPANKTFSLQEMYEYVGCEIVEFVYMNNGNVMVIDEEGKNNAKPLNSEATQIVQHNLFPGDYIAGNALVCSPNEID